MKKSSKAKNLQAPGQTKSSVHRQLLAAQKRLHKTSLVPDEALYCVFEYLDISDLLRCVCVCQAWRSVAEIPALWHKVFRRLPKVCQEISTKAKTIGDVDWKKECIFCVKERRKRKINKTLRASDRLESNVKKKSEITRTFKVKWMLQVHESGSHGNVHEIYASEDFIFRDQSLTARWNDTVNLPSFSKIKTINLYAAMPVFFNSNLVPCENSVCTRSLLFTKSFKGRPLQSLCFVHKDDNVSVYSLENIVYFGVWNSSVSEKGVIAFVGFSIPQENLVSKIVNGSSQRVWQGSPHVVVPDDIDSNYGMHGYKMRVGIRNSRKYYFYDSFDFLADGEFIEDDKWLMIKWHRQEEYVFYDIKDKLCFTWKTDVIKGSIENLVILDTTLTDINQDVAWNFSAPVKAVKIENEPDNYSYDNCEIWELNVSEDEKRKCCIRLIKNSETNHSTMLSVKVLLHKKFLNEWFSTQYRL